MGSDRNVDELRSQLSNWGRWGDDDEIGTVNLITPEVRAAAAATIRTGRTVSLALRLERAGMQPPADARLNAHHVMLQTGTDVANGVQANQVDGWGYADDMVTVALQAATHWDALSHQFYDYQMYNGRSCELVNSAGAHSNSIDRLSGKIVTRGILLDLPAVLGFKYLPIDYRVTQHDIEKALERANLEARSGDILIFRTGNIERATQDGGWTEYTYTSEPGIGIETLSWLQEREIAGVASDTWAFECIPSGSDIWLPVHAAAIVYMGLLIGENFWLQRLAEVCAELRCWEFLLCANPLPFSRAVSGMVNPVAIF